MSRTGVTPIFPKRPVVFEDRRRPKQERLNKSGRAGRAELRYQCRTWDRSMQTAFLTSQQIRERRRTDADPWSRTGGSSFGSRPSRKKEERG